MIKHPHVHLLKSWLLIFIFCFGLNWLSCVYSLLLFFERKRSIYTKPSGFAWNCEFYRLLPAILLTAIKIISDWMLVRHLSMPARQPSSNDIHVMEGLLERSRQRWSNADRSIRRHLLNSLCRYVLLNLIAYPGSLFLFVDQSSARRQWLFLDILLNFLCISLWSL